MTTTSATLTARAEDLLEDLADQQAETDEIAEENADDFADALRELLTSVEGRDPGIWSRSLESSDLEDVLSIEATIDELASVPSDERAEVWAAQMALLVSTSQVQAFVDVALPRILAAAEEHGERQVSGAAPLDIEELRVAARVGVSRDRLRTARERRQGARENG